MRMSLKALGFSTALVAVALYGMPSAQATPVSPNGSFGFVPIGSTTATTSGTYEIGPDTTSVTVPSDLTVNTTTIGGSLLGSPDNLSVAAGSVITLSSDTFTIPTLNTTSTLPTPLTVTVTNSLSDVLTFTFTSVLATSSGNGALDLFWLGDLTSDSADAFIDPSSASFSAAFTGSGSTAVGNASFSLQTPPAAPPPITPTPEPASMAILGVGTFALGVARRRKR